MRYSICFLRTTSVKYRCEAVIRKAIKSPRLLNARSVTSIAVRPIRLASNHNCSHISGCTTQLTTGWAEIKRLKAATPQTVHAEPQSVSKFLSIDPPKIEIAKVKRTAALEKYCVVWVTSDTHVTVIFSRCRIFSALQTQRICYSARPNGERSSKHLQLNGSTQIDN